MCCTWMDLATSILPSSLVHFTGSSFAAAFDRQYAVCTPQDQRLILSAVGDIEHALNATGTAEVVQSLRDVLRQVRSDRCMGKLKAEILPAIKMNLHKDQHRTTLADILKLFGNPMLSDSEVFIEAHRMITILRDSAPPPLLPGQPSPPPLNAFPYGAAPKPPSPIPSPATPPPVFPTTVASAPSAASGEAKPDERQNAHSDPPPKSHTEPEPEPTNIHHVKEGPVPVPQPSKEPNQVETVNQGAESAAVLPASPQPQPPILKAAQPKPAEQQENLTHESREPKAQSASPPESEELSSTISAGKSAMPNTETISQMSSLPPLPLHSAPPHKEPLSHVSENRMPSAGSDIVNPPTTASPLNTTSLMTDYNTQASDLPSPLSVATHPVAPPILSALSTLGEGGNPNPDDLAVPVAPLKAMSVPGEENVKPLPIEKASPLPENEQTTKQEDNHSSSPNAAAPLPSTATHDDAKPASNLQPHSSNAHGVTEQPTSPLPTAVLAEAKDTKDFETAPVSPPAPSVHKAVKPTSASPEVIAPPSSPSTPPLCASPAQHPAPKSPKMVAKTPVNPVIFAEVQASLGSPLSPTLMHGQHITAISAPMSHVKYGAPDHVLYRATRIEITRYHSALVHQSAWVSKRFIDYATDNVHLCSPVYHQTAQHTVVCQSSVQTVLSSSFEDQIDQKPSVLAETSEAPTESIQNRAASPKRKMMANRSIKYPPRISQDSKIQQEFLQAGSGSGGGVPSSGWRNQVQNLEKAIRQLDIDIKKERSPVERLAKMQRKLELLQQLEKETAQEWNSFRQGGSFMMGGASFSTTASSPKSKSTPMSKSTPKKPVPSSTPERPQSATQPRKQSGPTNTGARPATASLTPRQAARRASRELLLLASPATTDGSTTPAANVPIVSPPSITDWSPLSSPGGKENTEQPGQEDQTELMPSTLTTIPLDSTLLNATSSSAVVASPDGASPVLDSIPKDEGLDEEGPMSRNDDMGGKGYVRRLSDAVNKTGAAGPAVLYRRKGKAPSSPSRRTQKQQRPLSTTNTDQDPGTLGRKPWGARAPTKSPSRPISTSPSRSKIRPRASKAAFSSPQSKECVVAEYEDEVPAQHPDQSNRAEGFSNLPSGRLRWPSTNPQPTLVSAFEPASCLIDTPPATYFSFAPVSAARSQQPQNQLHSTAAPPNPTQAYQYPGHPAELPSGTGVAESDDAVTHATFPLRAKNVRGYSPIRDSPGTQATSTTRVSTNQTGVTSTGSEYLDRELRRAANRALIDRIANQFEFRQEMFEALYANMPAPRYASKLHKMLRKHLNPASILSETSSKCTPPPTRPSGPQPGFEFGNGWAGEEHAAVEDAAFEQPGHDGNEDQERHPPLGTERRSSSEFGDPSTATQGQFPHPVMQPKQASDDPLQCEAGRFMAVYRASISSSVIAAGSEESSYPVSSSET